MRGYVQYTSGRYTLSEYSRAQGWGKMGQNRHLFNASSRKPNRAVSVFASRARAGILASAILAIVAGSLAAFNFTNVSFSVPAIGASPAAAAAPAPASQQYVAIGDSYSAGEGLAPYELGTDTDKDSCNRSVSKAYPSIVAKFLRLKSFSFHACSGAHLSALNSSFKTEPPQLGWLSSSDNLVTLSLGGNDLNWSATVANCAEIHNGGKNKPVLYGPSSQCDSTLAAAPALISSITNQLFADYKAIRAAAPNARIRVMLYPPIFPERGATTAACVLGTRYGFAIGLSAAHEAAMASIEQSFNSAIELAVNSIRENFNGGDFFAADPAVQFLGYTGHTISCGDAGRDKPWVNGLRTDNFPSRPPTSEAGFLKDLKSLFLISDASFHPTVAGQQAMAQAMELSLQLTPPPPTSSPTAPASPVITTTSLPDGTVGQAYSQSLSTADQRSGTWSIVNGFLPAGLTLSGSTIQGVPTDTGNSSFTVAFTDAQGQSAKAQLSITVDAASSPWTPARGGLPENAAPSPNVYSAASAVSCPTSSSCVAVGGYDLLGSGVTFTADVLTQSGKAWNAIEAPLPSNSQTPGTSGVVADSGLNGISCPSSSSCVAVGQYTDNSGGTQGMLETLAGGSWTVAEAKLPADAATDSPSASVNGISCSSSSECIAVGEYSDSAHKQHALVITLANGSWATAVAPLPANSANSTGSTAYLSGVSCSSSSACVAVGDYTDTSGDTQGLVLTLAAGTWTAAEAKLPSDAASNPFVALRGVSCPSTTACVVAGGYYGPNTNGSTGLLLTMSNGSWTAASAPLPAGTSGTPAVTLMGVSCSTSSACVTTGYYSPSVNADHGELLTLANGSWNAINAPLPSNAGTSVPSRVFGVSCASTSQCTAVGDYTGDDGVDSLFLTGPA